MAEKGKIMLLAFIATCVAVSGRGNTEVLWPGGDVRVTAQSGAVVTTDPDGMIRMDVAEAGAGKFPAVYFEFPTPRDLSKITEVRMVLTNRCAQSLNIALKIKGDTQQGQLPERAYFVAPFAASSPTLRLYAERWAFDKPHGLKGLKRCPHVGNGSSFSLDRVRCLSVYVPPGTRDAAIGISRIELVSDLSQCSDVVVLKADTFFPWVDEFGQATFVEYPDKVHSEDELRARMEDEERAFREIPSGIPSADRFGGWADGPLLKATGHFRTEKVNGKWWLVDPDGRLFFIHGINYTWERIPTGITKRENYFEKLPPDAGDTAEFWQTHTSPAPANHNFYSDPANVPFKVFTFSSYNLYRKFGKDWAKKNVENNEKRMRSWGINTLTTAPREAIRAMKMPYVVSIDPSSRKIVSVKGYWSSLLDPFAPEFAESCRRSVLQKADIGTNEYCIGWTAHNELGWGLNGATLARGVLRAPDDQPAKVALLQILAAKGKTEATATEEDLRQLGEAVADKYYATVRAAIKEVAPYALYLGDRNDKTNPEVFRAASRYLDVITVNVYDYHPTRELPSGAVDKPFLVTEFHFGCYDTGYFYASLLPVKDQKTRAKCYRTYLRAALDDPNYVGTCWFCWRDCPISGDWNEGANAQCGLVSVTDVPYTEMVRAMRDISGEMYFRRSGAAMPIRDFKALPLPDYAKERVASTLKRFRAWKGSDETVVIPFITDVHDFRSYFSASDTWFGAKTHIRFLRYAAEQFGADLMGDLGDKGIDRVGSYLQTCDKRHQRLRIACEQSLYRDYSASAMFNIPGNHDHGHMRALVSNADFGLYFNSFPANDRPGFSWSQNRDYGRYDVPGKNCRVIFLNTTETAKSNGYGMSADQVAFARRELETTPKGWSVIVFSHLCLHPTCGFFKVPGRNPPVYEGVTDVREAMKAAAARKDIHFVGCICGDSHFDLDYTEDGVRYLISQGYGFSSKKDLPPDQPSAEFLRFDRRNEMLVDVACIKPATGELRLFRIGAGDASRDR